MSDTSDAVSIEPPDFASEYVAAIVAKEFDLRGQYTQLVSERDQNFRLITADGNKFVVKVTGLAEETVATDFQIALLSHLEETGFDYAPRVVRTVTGRQRSGITSDAGQEYSLRVVTWLDGSLLQDVEWSTGTIRNFGQRLAELDQTLGSFETDSDGQAGLWNMQAASQLKNLLSHVDDRSVYQLASGVLDQFDDTANAALRALPRQAIHNDANPENILMDADGEVCGFIDFGDALKAPRVVEIAVAASYLRSGGKNPLEFIEAFVAGYHQQSPLSDDEFELLFDLIRTRLVTSLTIMYWRLAARDENDPYRQKTLQSENNAFEFLVFLSRLGRDAFVQRLKVKQ
ncbi:MAG: phosphotransferase [Gammaproteobacteria bacterium]|nr:phosphotransferase [Gammaproteobacteria bacterium]